MKEFLLGCVFGNLVTCIVMWFLGGRDLKHAKRKMIADNARFEAALQTFEASAAEFAKRSLEKDQGA